MPVYCDRHPPVFTNANARAGEGVTGDGERPPDLRPHDANPSARTGYRTAAVTLAAVWPNSTFFASSDIVPV